MTYDDLLTTVGGVPLILADLRARATAGAVLPPDEQPLVIGSNLVPTNVAFFGNLNSLSTWQNANAGYAFGDPPKNAASGSYYVHNLPAPEADGQFHTYSWQEPDNPTSTSTWTRRFTSADVSNTRMTDLTTSYAAGVFTARFRYFGDFSSTDPRGRVEWRGQGTIVPVDFREESLPRTTRIRPQIVDVSSQLPGDIRFLELCQFNDWAQDWAWSERQRVSPPAGYVTKQPGMPIEDCIAICNATNRSPGWVFTHKLSEATIKATMRAFFYGEGTDDGVKLNPSLIFSVELCDNEPWHTPFTGAWGDLSSIGYATGYQGSDNNFSRLYAQAKRSQQVATWIEEAVPDQMHRVIRIASLSPDNDLTDYTSLIGYGLTKFEAVTQSIYMGIGIKNTRYGSNTPAELQAPFSEDAARQVTAFLRNRPRYIADGKRHLAYEIGIDVAGSVWTPAEKDAFLLDPGTMDTYRREWRRIASENGDRCSIYWDFGYYRQPGFGSWGHYQGHGLPSPKWDVVVVVQAEVEAGVS